MAHITGGGITQNIPRIIPEGLGVEISLNSWKPPQIFEEIKEKGNISEEEMYKTFNMGVGFVMIVEPTNARHLMSLLTNEGFESSIIGVVRNSKTKIKYV